MVSLSKPEIIVTHESDLDGLVSGLLLKRLASQLYDTEVPLLAYHNHAWRQRSLNEKAAWVCDITFESRMDRPQWLIVDHHTTEAQARRATLVHDINKSAGLLAFELCLQNGVATSPELERLVHLNNVADLFLENDPDFIAATDYANLVKTYSFWNLYELIEGRLENLINHPLLEVMAVKRRVEDPLGYNWSRAKITSISPSIGFVDTVVGNINTIVHQLLESGDLPYQVLVTLFRKGNGTIIASFRSRNGEAIKAAEKLQGGGHANASGATLPRSVQQISDAITYLKQVLNPPPPKGNSLNSLEELFASIDLEKK